jgi:AraC-like DNA-binding protein
MTRDKKPNNPRGLIEKHISRQYFDLFLITPQPALQDIVANYWLVEWDLAKGISYKQSNLPHASQHFVIDPQTQSGIYGITTGAFDYELSGRGRVLGVKFLPGHFRQFAAHSMEKLTNTFLPIQSYFELDVQELEATLLSSKAHEKYIDPIEAALLDKRQQPDARALEAQKAVQFIEDNREIFTVNMVARHFNVSPRGLQRLFADFIGVGPKWVIERYRMIEAVEAMNSDDEISLTELAHALGYYDQAHFSKAFRAVTGRTPSEVTQSRP